MNDLQGMLAALATLYRRLVFWKAEASRRAEIYKATQAFRDYEVADGLRRDVKAAADALKGEIREAIVAAFVAAEGDRSALPEGTGIRVSKGKPTLVYLDEMAALEWLRENAIGTLVPNNATVQAMVEAGTVIPGVTVVQEGEGGLTATITSQSKLLALYPEEEQIEPNTALDGS